TSTESRRNETDIEPSRKKVGPGGRGGRGQQWKCSQSTRPYPTIGSYPALARVEWARSISPKTPDLAAKWHSKFFRPNSSVIEIACLASSRKRKPHPLSI